MWRQIVIVSILFYIVLGQIRSHRGHRYSPINIEPTYSRYTSFQEEGNFPPAEFGVVHVHPYDSSKDVTTKSERDFQSEENKFYDERVLCNKNNLRGTKHLFQPPNRDSNLSSDNDNVNKSSQRMPSQFFGAREFSKDKYSIRHFTPTKESSDHSPVFKTLMIDSREDLEKDFHKEQRKWGGNRRLFISKEDVRNDCLFHRLMPPRSPNEMQEYEYGGGSSSEDEYGKLPEEFDEHTYNVVAGKAEKPETKVSAYKDIRGRNIHMEGVYPIESRNGLREDLHSYLQKHQSGRRKHLCNIESDQNPYEYFTNESEIIANKNSKKQDEKRYEDRVIDKSMHMFRKLDGKESHEMKAEELNMPEITPFSRKFMDKKEIAVENDIIGADGKTDCRENRRSDMAMNCTASPKRGISEGVKIYAMGALIESTTLSIKSREKAKTDNFKIFGTIHNHEHIGIRNEEQLRHNKSEINIATSTSMPLFFSISLPPTLPNDERIMKPLESNDSTRSDPK
ncbi:hypothetical protein DICVIV_01615 [Dictyocaulus viviparus]|uniref:Uncharacterized protein n=1 Tax=Dictyocaulus viviparus TaxID=29172 RepID=A0A0D8Y5Y2_DICVI|nr:hypothetical protein DICVIV_01615 [Dictyocaulus viviparus]